jgi:hypothetical protein
MVFSSNLPPPSLSNFKIFVTSQPKFEIASPVCHLVIFPRTSTSKSCTFCYDDLENGKSHNRHSNGSTKFEDPKDEKRCSILDTWSRLSSASVAKREIFSDFVFFEIIKINDRRLFTVEAVARKSEWSSVRTYPPPYSSLKILKTPQLKFEIASHRISHPGFARVPSSY